MVRGHATMSFLSRETLVKRGIYVKCKRGIYVKWQRSLLALRRQGNGHGESAAFHSFYRVESCRFGNYELQVQVPPCALPLRTKPRCRTVECRRARSTCFPLPHCCCGALDPHHNNQRKEPKQDRMGNGSGRKCCLKREMR